MQLKLIIVLMLGIFMVLLSAFKVEACSSMSAAHVHKACCEKNTSGEQQSRDINKNDNNSDHANAQSDQQSEAPSCTGCHGDKDQQRCPCKGKCQHNCGSTAQQLVPILLLHASEPDLEIVPARDLLQVEKTIRLPSGFDFIWRPPKI